MLVINVGGGVVGGRIPQTTLGGANFWGQCKHSGTPPILLSNGHKPQQGFRTRY